MIDAVANLSQECIFLFISPIVLFMTLGFLLRPVNEKDESRRTNPLQPLPERGVTYRALCQENLRIDVCIKG